ncbi:uncharacterized protein N7477_001330 [Penicillium maclennaniae]|uniref:uncharacterized protein n=1 Tax=Penicillium maclennaniae TaxID=1343394 RepID=UPI0025422EC1|nr:uncharacterized protein N7477_001330 [Penicillium maclennaniae]KAJ5681390.1 hypothetical protein N7477_001330 [Penicillium maclennaniae]
MASTSTHWGTLINPDKSPAPLLEQLCLGIAQLMPSFDSNGTSDLTPDRLAAFYRKVGGNYDPLFLATKAQSLSFIYQSLGCFHSLQPSTNPYEPPSIPSLLPNGFVRWQTIQILMDPDEHSRFLQEAVKQWDIVDAQGQIFPKEIPRDAFPSEPDPEMTQWHEGVCRRLEYDYVKRNVQHHSPPNFGAYPHYHFSGKDPLPDEEDYFARNPRRSNTRRQSHYDAERSSGRRHHHRRLSAEYPASSSRRHEPAYAPRPDGGRSGGTSPRELSPTGFAEHSRHSQGRDRPSGYTRDTEDVPDDLDFSDNSTRHEDNDLRPRARHSSRHHNLSPPTDSRARRHSHDAYIRKPARELSPSSKRRYESYDRRSTKPSKMTSDRHREVRSQSRPPGVQFRNYIFDPAQAPAPATAPAPDPPQYAVPPPPPRGPPRHRYDAYLAEDGRRGSYSGGSTGGSRPNSGGSGSEKPRSYSSAGLYPRTGRWTSPQRSSAAKRYIPTRVAEDPGYIPSPRRAI